MCGLSGVNAISCSICHALASGCIQAPPEMASPVLLPEANSCTVCGTILSKYEGWYDCKGYLTQLLVVRVTLVELIAAWYLVAIMSEPNKMNYKAKPNEPFIFRLTASWIRNNPWLSASVWIDQLQMTKKCNGCCYWKTNMVLLPED
jgi:hypothetical protein